jgi:MscS family membrane protein
LFGTLSIGVDQPFRETDFVKVGEVIGTVEAIGLRSTRIRTLDRTLITIPNGKLADMSVESYAVRDRMRLFCMLPLVLGTPSAQVRKILQGIEEVLRAHPKIWRDDLVVRFKELSSFAMNVEVMAWFQADNWAEFQLIRQDMLLAILEVLEANQARLAYPTQTLKLSGGEPGGAQHPEAPPQAQAQAQEQEQA